MLDFEFVNKIINLKDKKCRLIKCKNNHAIVEIYVNSVVPKYSLKFYTTHNARSFLMNIHCFNYEEIKLEEDKKSLKYQKLFI